MVAAVATSETEREETKGRKLCHMRKSKAFRGLLLLDVLNYRTDDLVQRALGHVAEARGCFTDIRDAVLHILEALAISLRVGQITNGTFRAGGCNNLVGKSVNRNLFRISQIENFPNGLGGSHACQNAFNNVLDMAETTRLFTRPKHR